jgi:hypothetical protein
LGHDPTAATGKALEKFSSRFDPDRTACLAANEGPLGACRQPHYHELPLIGR